MKRILYMTILIFAMAHLVKSQTLDEMLNAKSGTYLPSTELDKFIGKWQGTLGQDTFRIFLKKVKVKYPINDIFVDKLYGLHEFKKGNLVIESSMNYNLTDDLSKYTLMGGFYENYLSFSFSDLTKNKWGRASIKFTAGIFDEGIWSIIPKEMNADSNPPSVWTVPKNIILKKVQ